MNDERDNLAAVIRESYLFPKDGEVALDSLRAADRLIAAGYRKPRVVTNEEEVSALPEGTKLYSPKTTDLWELHDLATEFGGVRVVGTGGGYTYIADFVRQQAPLEVLYTPDSA